MVKYPNKIPIKGRVRYCLELLYSQKPKGKVVLDVGSSFGWMAQEVLKEKPRRFIGVEPDVEKVKHAKRKGTAAEFYQGVAERLPAKSNSVDMVSMFDVIEHVPKNSEMVCFREIHRVLKKGGALILSTPNSHWLTNITDPAWYFGHRHYKPKKMKKMITKAGFKIDTVEVRGRIWGIIYLNWFYTVKWILGKNNPRSDWLEKMDDLGYNKTGGIFTLYVLARRI